MATKRTKRWVVPIEASVTGYVTVDASDEAEAVDMADQMVEDAQFGLTEDGPSIDIADFDKLVVKGQVFAGMATDNVVPYRKPRSKTTTAKKKTTTKKATTKGRARGGAASTAKKTTTKKKAATTKKNPSGSAGRRRGVSSKK